MKFTTIGSKRQKLKNNQYISVMIVENWYKSTIRRTIEQIKTSAIVSPNKSVLAKQDEIEGIRVKSPIIGTAYLAPEPGAKKFVEVGDKIKKGQTVMIVEAMKTMNHVPSTSDGVVKKILVNDGQPVEFGQTLIILE